MADEDTNLPLISSPSLMARNGDADNFRFSSVDFSAIFDPLDVNSQDGLNTLQQQNMYNQEYGSLLEPHMNHEETEMLINLFHSAVDRSRSDSLGNPIGDNSVSGSKGDESDEYQKLVEGLIGSVGEAKKNKRKRTDSLNAPTMDCEADSNPNAREKNDGGNKGRGPEGKIKIQQGAQKPSRRTQRNTQNTSSKDRNTGENSMRNKLSNNRRSKKGRCQEGNSHAAASTNSHAECEESDNSRSSRSSSTSLGEKSPASSATDGIGEEEVGNNVDYLSDSELKADDFNSPKATFRNNSPNKGNNNFVVNATLGKKIHFDNRPGEKSGDESGGDLTTFASNDSNSSAQTVSVESRQRNDRGYYSSTRPRKTKAVTVEIQCEMDPDKTILAMKRKETMGMKRRIEMLEQQRSLLRDPVSGTSSVGNQQQPYRPVQHIFEQPMPSSSSQVLDGKSEFKASLQVQQFLRSSIRRQNPVMDKVQVFQQGEKTSFPMQFGYKNRERHLERPQESYHTPIGYMGKTSPHNSSIYAGAFGRGQDDAWRSPTNAKDSRMRPGLGGLSRSTSTPDIRNLVRKAAYNETSRNSKLRDFLKEQVDEFLQNKRNYLHNVDGNMQEPSPHRHLDIPASQSASSVLYGNFNNNNIDKTYITSQERRHERRRMDYSNSIEPKTYFSDAVNVDDYPQQAGSNAGKNNRHLDLFGNLEPSRKAIEMSRRQLQDASIGDSKFQKFKDHQPLRSSSASHAFSHDGSPQNVRRVWSHPV